MKKNKESELEIAQTLNYSDLKSAIGENLESAQQPGKSKSNEEKNNIDIQKKHLAKINLAPSPKEQKKAKAKHLTKKYVLAKRNIKYIAIGAVSFLIFALIYNLPVLFLKLSYSFKKHDQTQTQQAKTPAQPINNQPEKVPAQNLIIIPKINVNAPVTYLDSRDEKEVQMALREGVVHYGGTALPGQNGNSVIFGHSSNDLWEPGNYKFVFANLDQMVVGDKIQLNYDSKKYQYEVYDKKVVEPNDLSVLNQTTDPVLTLITCTPPGTSWRRLIVLAKQFDPIPENNLPAPKKEQLPQPKTLPSNAPGIFDQISIFFKNIF